MMQVKVLPFGLAWPGLAGRSQGWQKLWARSAEHQLGAMESAETNAPSACSALLTDAGHGAAMFLSLAF
ncbi:MAG TPA: hypothetical protein VF988_13035 [Verrucomicrobiae bacterium]